MTLLADLCNAARGDLAAVGGAAGPLVSITDTVARIAGSRDLAALDDPLLALDVLTAGVTADGELVGRVFTYLRQRAGSAVPPPAPAVTIAAALVEYRAGAFLQLGANSQRTYKTWLMRLERTHGTRGPREVTTADLTDLIVKYAPRRRSEGRHRRLLGVSAARSATYAFRHFWRYLAAQGRADADVAQALPMPKKVRHPNRRAYTPTEAALVRHLAGSGRDPMLDTLVVLLAERACLRRAEICDLRFCDLDFDAEVLAVWGKGDRPDEVPMTPGLAAFLRRYVRDRCPVGVPLDVWLRGSERVLRRGPSERHPHGRRLTRRYVENMLARFKRLAPELYADESLCLHTFRHTASVFLEAPFGRSVAQAALRHAPNTASDWYFPVPLDKLREALTAYESHLLAGQPTPDAAPPADLAGDLAAAA